MLEDERRYGERRRCRRIRLKMKNREEGRDIEIKYFLVVRDRKENVLVIEVFDFFL
jgi:hypothetical protein